MKTVFTSSEIAHRFFHTDDNAIGRSQANMSFRDGTFFSYYTPIWWRRQHNGETVHFRNITNYSVTTRRHQRLVCQARLTGNDIVTVWGIGRGCYRHATTSEIAHKAIECRIESAREAEEAACKPRIRQATKERHIAHAAAMREQAAAIAARFGLPAPVFAPLSEEAREEIRQAKLAEAAREKKRKAEAEEEERKTLELVKEHLASYAATWRAGITWAGKAELSPYVASRVSLAFRQSPPIFRVHDGQVESSLGAIVPVGDFTKAVRLARMVRASRDLPWVPPTDHTVGIYRLDRIDNDGVHVGCHHVTWDEVEKCAEMLGM